MRTHLFIAPLCALVACASISGTQTFQATRVFTLPKPGAVASDTGPHTITALGATDKLSFADSVLGNVEQLRERDHIDAADAAIRVVSVRLSTDTTFAGVSAIRAQLVIGSETIELCSRTLSAAEQKASSVSCDADHVLDEATLQQETKAAAAAQIGAQLEVSGAVTATKLNTFVTFQVEVNVDASL